MSLIDSIVLWKFEASKAVYEKVFPDIKLENSKLYRLCAIKDGKSENIQFSVWNGEYYRGAFIKPEKDTNSLVIVYTRPIKKYKIIELKVFDAETMELLENYFWHTKVLSLKKRAKDPFLFN